MDAVSSTKCERRRFSSDQELLPVCLPLSMKTLGESQLSSFAIYIWGLSWVEGVLLCVAWAR